MPASPLEVDVELELEVPAPDVALVGCDEPPLQAVALSAAVNRVTIG
jgi:hypothetical protein